MIFFVIPTEPANHEKFCLAKYMVTVIVLDITPDLDTALLEISLLPFCLNISGYDHKGTFGGSAAS